MSSIERELQSDMQRERLQRIWHSYGKLVTVVIGSLTLLAIGYVLWNNYQARTDARLTTNLFNAAKAFQSADFEQTMSEINLLKTDNAHAPQTALGLYLAGASAAKEADYDAATTYFTQAASHPKADKALQNLSEISAWKLGQNYAITVAEPTIADGEPYYTLYREMQAWQHVSEDNGTEAATIFWELSLRAETLPSERKRMQEIALFLDPAVSETSLSEATPQTTNGL